MKHLIDHRPMMGVRYMERIADHATNVAEEVIFAVHGRDVRHGNVDPDLPEINGPRS